MSKFPICMNCKYFVEEFSGTKSICGLTALDPVTGKKNARKARPASVYRNKNYPCGPSGAFYIEGEQRVDAEINKPEPKKEVEKPKVETVKVELPTLIEEEQEVSKEEDNLLPLEPGQKRRRRKKAE